MTPGSAAPGRRRTGSTRARWRACCGGASLRRCGCLMSVAGFCAGGSRGASSWCALARARRTRSTRCCSAGCRSGRRALTCSGSRAASGSPSLELPVEERESVDAGHPPDRVPRRGDRGGRAADRPAGAVLAGDPAADDRAGREPGLRRDVHRRGRRHADRFLTSRKLVAYLGLDPKVRQSGRGASALRPDLQARVGVRALGAGRSGVERGAAARPAARVL